MTRTLARRPESSLALGLAGHLTPSNYELPTDVSIEVWAKDGRLLGQIGRASPWWIGAWLVAGDDRFGEAYAQFVHETGYAEQTLLNLASVARHVAPAQRRADFSWSHHAEIVGEKPERQAEFLARAVAEGWSSKKLRQVVQGGTGRAEKVPLGEVGDALAGAVLGLLRELPPGAGSEGTRENCWTAADAWLERRGREPVKR